MAGVDRCQACFATHDAVCAHDALYGKRIAWHLLQSSAASSPSKHIQIIVQAGYRLF